MSLTSHLMLLCTCVQDADVGLLDADVYGPSIPTMMNLTGPIHLTKRKFAACFVHDVSSSSSSS